MKRIIKWFSRSKLNNSPQILQYIKILERYKFLRNLQSYCNQPLLAIADFFKNQDYIQQLYLFGKNNYVVGNIDLNYDNTNFIKDIVQYLKPESIILGTTNLAKLSTYSNSNKLQQNRGQNQFCKQRFTLFFLNKEPLNLYINNQQKIVFQIKNQTNYLIPIVISYQKNDLTVVLLSFKTPSSKLVFGKPDDVLLLQDIILNFDSKQLRQMIELSISKAKLTCPQQFQSFILMQAIRNQAKSNFSDLLFKKWKIFTYNVFRECSKLYKNPLVIHDAFLLPLCQQIMPYNMIYEPFRKEFKELKQQHKNYIEEQKMKYQRTKNMTKEQFIQRFVLGGLLLQNKVKQYLDRKIIPKNTIFQDFFAEGQFDKQLQYLNHRVQINLKQLHNWQNKKIKIIRNPIQNYNNLQKQIKIINDEQFGNYQLKPNDLVQKRINQNKMQFLYDQIVAELQAQDDIQTLKLVKQVIQKQYTKENILIFCKLLKQKAQKFNLEIDFPVFHFKHFKHFYNFKYDKLIEDEKQIQNKTYKQENNLLKELKKNSKENKKYRLLTQEEFPELKDMSHKELQEHGFNRIGMFTFNKNEINIDQTEQKQILKAFEKLNPNYTNQ